METKNKLIQKVIVSVIAAFLIVIFIYILCWGDKGDEYLARFGDYFGGTLGPVLTFIGFFWLWVSYRQTNDNFLRSEKLNDIRQHEQNLIQLLSLTPDKEDSDFYKKTFIYLKGKENMTVHEFGKQFKELMNPENENDIHISKLLKNLTILLRHIDLFNSDLLKEQEIKNKKRHFAEIVYSQYSKAELLLVLYSVVYLEAYYSELKKIIIDRGYKLGGELNARDLNAVSFSNDPTIRLCLQGLSPKV